MDVPQKFNHLKGNSSKRDPDGSRKKKALAVAAEKAARKKARQTARQRNRQGTAGTSMGQGQGGENNGVGGAEEEASSDEMVD